VKELLDTLRRAPDAVADAISCRESEALSRRPAPGSWAAVEVICHLRDVDEFYLHRIQLLLLNDEPSLVLLEPDRWAEERQYLRQAAAVALAAFRRRRAEMLGAVEPLGAEQLERAGHHPILGRITIAKILRATAAHDKAHLEQLTRALRGDP
jgi:uncharacterized damage-inducible protein DinB